MHTVYSNLNIVSGQKVKRIFVYLQQGHKNVRPAVTLQSSQSTDDKMTNVSNVLWETVDSLIKCGQRLFQTFKSTVKMHSNFLRLYVEVYFCMYFLLLLRFFILIIPTFGLVTNKTRVKHKHLLARKKSHI